jgi:hypothetical protein
MNRAHVLFHLVHASFLERVRRRNFLFTLFGVILLSLAIATGRLILRLDVYIGEHNSAWVGALVAGSTTVLLCFVNFFIVKNVIALDRYTGVGELIASTPTSKNIYILGKALSNFVVLMAIEGVLLLSAILVQLVHGDQHIDWLAILLPFVFIALPAMATISALALLFEILPGLRSGFGNLIFVFLWFYMMFRVAAYDEVWVDLPGILYVNTVFTQAAQSMDLPFEGGFSVEGGMMVDSSAQHIRWENVSWINEMVGWRLYWFGVAICLTLLAAVLFDRFDSSRKFTNIIRWPLRKIPGDHMHRKKPESINIEVVDITCDPSISCISPKVHLSPINKISRIHFFGRVLWSELRLSLKRPWWWFLISLGLLVMSLIVPVLDAHTFWVPLIWLWLSLTLSEIGIRESHHRTDQLTFSAPYPLRYQFFATWMAGVILTLTMGIAGARLFLGGETSAALAWFIGALFIPTFALAAGILSRNRRLFEGVYIAWWLMGPMASKGTGLDFMGVHPEVVARGIHWYYLIATILLLGLALLGRWRQLRSL